MTKRKIEGMVEIEEDQDGKMKIEFAPGCFDEFNGTQEELDAMVAQIQHMFESGDIGAMNTIDIEDLIETDPEVADKIFQALQDDSTPRKLQ